MGASGGPPPYNAVSLFCFVDRTQKDYSLAQCCFFLLFPSSASSTVGAVRGTRTIYVLFNKPHFQSRRKLLFPCLFNASVSSAASSLLNDIKTPSILQRCVPPQTVYAHNYRKPGGSRASQWLEKAFGQLLYPGCPIRVNVAMTFCPPS